MANLKDLIVNGSARILGSLYVSDIKNSYRTTEFIVGTQTASTGSWTGVSEDTELYNGKNIHYFLPYAGNGNATLNLTLADGTTTGAKPIYLWGTSYLTTHYGANSCIDMTYNASKGAWFIDADRDSNNVDRLQHTNNIHAAAGIAANRLIAGTNAGYKEVAANVVYDISYPLLWANSAIASGNNNNNVFFSFPDRNLSVNKSGWTGTQWSVVYLFGTLSGTNFTIDANVFTTTKPTSEDGRVYTPIGVMFSTTNCYFRPTNTYYAYTNGSFQPISLQDVNMQYQGSVTNVSGDVTIALTRQQMLYRIKPTAVVNSIAFNTSSANLNASYAYTFELIIDNTAGAYTVSIPIDLAEWEGGTPPTINDQKMYMLVFRTMDAGVTWYGSLQGAW